MKILVTGAAGFIGSHFSEALLRQGHEVVGLDNFMPFYDMAIKRDNVACVQETATRQGAPWQLIEADIRDTAAVGQIFQAHKFDAVVHLAAMAGVRPSLENPKLYEEVNQVGTINLLEAARQVGLKNFVFASSSSVYGNAPKTPFSESDPVDNPISPYAATKKAGELTCHVYHAIYGMNIACLRFFTVYGPRQRPDLAIHKFTKLMFAGQKLPVYGDGSKKRDFTYIDDIIDGVSKSLTWVLQDGAPRYGVFNLGESRPVSVNELIAALEAASGIKAQIEWLPDMPGDVEVTYADVSRSRKILGYDPHTLLADGLPEFMRWFRRVNKI